MLNHNKYCLEAGSTSRHLLCEERLDVNSFLSKASEHDFDQFCLAYTLTWRDFSGGTLGLAWVGYPGEIFSCNLQYNGSNDELDWRIDFKYFNIIVKYLRSRVIKDCFIE